jgi:CO/xanthine dehydrogenase FAD-binding subunit
MSSKSSSRRPKGKRSTQTWKASADDTLQALLERTDTPPLLAQALRTLAWQTRNWTPLARVLASPGSAPQVVAALLAHGASVALDTEAAATAPLEELIAGGSERTPSEICLSLAGQPWGRATVGRTPADTPIVAALAVVRVGRGGVEEARIALTGVWPEPARLATSAARLVGRQLSADSISGTADAVAGECTPPTDFLGSEQYRRAMAAVLTRRALQACADRVGAGPKAVS